MFHESTQGRNNDASPRYSFCPLESSMSTRASILPTLESFVHARSDLGDGVWEVSEEVGE